MPFSSLSSSCVLKRNTACSSKSSSMSVHLFIVHDSSVRCTPSNEEWLKKMWCIQGRECCLAVQRNEVLMHAIVFMNLEKLKYKKSQKAAH